MKFGLFYLPTYLPQERDVAAHFDNIVEQVLYADRIGIDYVWMVEHHFVRHGGLCAGNYAFLSYLAAKTERIRPSASRSDSAARLVDAGAASRNRPRRSTSCRRAGSISASGGGSSATSSTRSASTCATRTTASPRAWIW